VLALLLVVAVEVQAECQEPQDLARLLALYIVQSPTQARTLDDS
jgi:hypothetical protein